MATNTKSKKKFNVIDFIIVILIIGCIVGIVFRSIYVNRLLTSGGSDTASVSFTAAIPGATASQVSVDDVFYVVSNNMPFGSITSVVTGENYVYEEAENGRLVKTLDETSSLLTGKLNVQGIDTQNGFMLGGTYFIAPGQSFEIIGKKARFTIMITDIET